MSVGAFAIPWRICCLHHGLMFFARQIHSFKKSRNSKHKKVVKTKFESTKKINFESNLQFFDKTFIWSWWYWMVYFVEFGQGKSSKGSLSESHSSSSSSFMFRFSKSCILKYLQNKYELKIKNIIQHLYFCNMPMLF